jgi:hypothetical protein
VQCGGRSSSLVGGRLGRELEHGWGRLLGQEQLRKGTLKATTRRQQDTACVTTLVCTHGRRPKGSSNGMVWLRHVSVDAGSCSRLLDHPFPSLGIWTSVLGRVATRRRVHMAVGLGVRRWTSPSRPRGPQKRSMALAPDPRIGRPCRIGWS